MKRYLLATLQAGFAYVSVFIGGGVLLPAGDISYRDCAIRDGLYGLIAALLMALLLQKVARPILMGALFAAILLAAIASTQFYPSSIVSRLLF